MLQVQMVDQFPDVLGVALQGISSAGFGRISLAPGIHGDYPQLFGQRQGIFLEKFGGAEETGHHQDGKALADVLEIDVGAVGGGEKVAFCDCHVCDPFLGRITVLLLYKNWVINQIYRFYEKYNKKVIEEEGMWAKICDYR